MKKRPLLFLCAMILLLSTAARAEAVPFARTRSYDERFSDVSARAWYHDPVAALYEYGLTEGVSRTAYAPDESVTVAELTAFAARLRALDMGESVPAPAAGEAWYQSGVDYLKSAGALGDAFDGHYADAATRAQAAGILAPALRAERYDERNAEAVTVGYAARQYITDVDDYTPYQGDILLLYKRGIAGGVDAMNAQAAALGLSRGQTLRHVVVPQAVRFFYPKGLTYRAKNSQSGHKFAEITP